VATLQCPAQDWRHNEDQPPVVLGEADDCGHALILPQPPR
jgi:hypothetical protein